MNKDIKKYIDSSVLCWLATVSKDNIPNVSPKEVFTYHEDTIIIANIASPQSAKNIKHNNNICLSFIDILVQKGYQIKGNAEIIHKTYPEFKTLAQPLLKITEGKFPFSSIFKISVKSVKPIIAPKYVLYPETTEAAQIKSAKKTYGF
ncbi:pyridoxamine 5'-phosphate oxidase family protein [Hyunsoonleella ulvae]|uniref:pyridoxamine 5'-phosphate oxidase family protein n=1 Tax=Hyunsoonleella ulvae TaxID=2799948 RepID=UPI00193968B2|nr:pyridoxamine 5'-phosphate oxidase family protein [Hyunsoonleella ulvae]